MSDETISQLPLAVAYTGTEERPIDQGSAPRVTRRVSDFLSFPPMAAVPASPLPGWSYLNTVVGYPLVYGQDAAWHPVMTGIPTAPSSTPEALAAIGWPALTGLMTSNNTIGGPHTGNAVSVMALSGQPFGSGLNGPATADYGLTIAMVKENFLTSTQPGEMDGLQIIVRQGYDDSAGILVNTGVVSGYTAILEGVSYQFQAATGAILQGMDVQLGGIETGLTGSPSAIGLNVFATNGTLDDGVFIQSAAGAGWTNAIRVNDNAGPLTFNLTPAGVMYLGPNITAGTSILFNGASNVTNGFAIQIIGNGVTTPSKFLRVFNGAFQIVNDANSAVTLTSADNGDLTAGGALVATSYAQAPIFKLPGSSTGITSIVSANAGASNFTLTMPAATDRLVGRNTTDTLTNKSIAVTQITGVATVAQGGTNSASASGTALDNISGFSTVGALFRTGAGAYVTFEPQTVVLVVAGVNFNTANTDTVIPVSLPVGTRYRVSGVAITNASATLTTATFGLYTAAAAGGVAIIAGQAITVSTGADNTVNNVQNVAPATAATQTFNAANLYFRTGTAEGSPATGSVIITLVPMYY